MPGHFDTLHQLYGLVDKGADDQWEVPIIRVFYPHLNSSPSFSNFWISDFLVSHVDALLMTAVDDVVLRMTAVD